MPEDRVRAGAKKAVGAVDAEAADVEKVSAAAAPSEDLPGGGAQPLVKGVKAAGAEPSAEISPAPKPAAKSKRKAVHRAVRAKKAAAESPDAAAKAAPSPAADKPGHYVLSFSKNTHQMTAASEEALKKAASDLSADPLAGIKVVGHAAPDEADGDALAKERAKMVAGLLVNRYQVAPKKIAISSSAGDTATVEVSLAPND